MRHVLCPGTYDPVTLGHRDVLERALRLFDRVTLAVAAGGRSTLLPHDVRLRVAEEVVAGLDDGDRCQVVGFDGLLVDTVRDLDADAVVRGVRGPADMDHELSMSALNRAMADGFETVLLPARPELSMISGTYVRDVARCGGPVHLFVPAPSAAALRERFGG